MQRSLDVHRVSAAAVAGSLSDTLRRKNYQRTE